MKHFNTFSLFEFACIHVLYMLQVCIAAQAHLSKHLFIQYGVNKFIQHKLFSISIPSFRT